MRKAWILRWRLLSGWSRIVVLPLAGTGAGAADAAALAFVGRLVALHLEAFFKTAALAKKI